MIEDAKRKVEVDFFSQGTSKKFTQLLAWED